MRVDEIRRIIMRDFRFNGNQKIYLTGNYKFEISFGHDRLEFDYPPDVMRHIRIDEILGITDERGEV